MKIKVTVLCFINHLYNYDMLSLFHSWVEISLNMYNLTLCHHLSLPPLSAIQSSICIKGLPPRVIILELLRLSKFTKVQAN